MPIVMTPKASPVYEHFDSTCCGRGIDVKDVKSVSNSDTTQGSYKFRQIAAFITGLMAKKNNGEASVHPKYWLEIKDQMHRDRVSLNGYDLKSGALGAWMADSNTKLGLFKWIDQHHNVEIEIIKGGLKHTLHQKLDYVHYLNPHQSLEYRIDILDGKWMKGNTLLDTTQLQGKSGMKGHAAIVIHRDGNIFVHPYEKGKWQHTSTTGGKPVLSAGMIKIENGQAESFHLDSGHYMPKLPQLENFLSRVAAKNVDLSQLEISTKNINQDEIDTLINKYSQ
ncbi:hypothetical protein HJ107_02475 [Vibrio parahaemolyticus]|uniref:hypothetical protein n=1 Tax=Vibrio parahaemolyticus TaxID=670 RepID=UPI001869A70C|nr:hypothetical protein [Vibrio parahaemolyticus]MBE4085715.1 hypothetical protein [Vibrio parahaemolyticus]MCQ9091950.1 hypothetical protein [Vibrio parahaemolyticus]